MIWLCEMKSHSQSSKGFPFHRRDADSVVHLGHAPVAVMVRPVIKELWRFDADAHVSGRRPCHSSRLDDYSRSQQSSPNPLKLEKIYFQLFGPSIRAIYIFLTNRLTIHQVPMVARDISWINCECLGLLVTSFSFS
jgi:hypothetical protein